MDSRRRLREFANRPVAELAKVCGDVVCAQMYRKKGWLEEQIKDMHESDFAVWNECSIRNAAFLSVHADSKRHRDLFAAELESYRRWINGEDTVTHPFWSICSIGIGMYGLYTLWSMI